MITLRKLKSLKESTRFRKYISILTELEDELKKEIEINLTYYKSILNEISNEKELSKRSRDLATQEISLRSINSLRHSIMAKLNIEPSEWDFTSPKDKDSKSNQSLPINMFLDDIRSPFNLGSLFRTGECFGVSNIYISEDTTSPNHKRAQRTSMGCIDLINWEVKKLEELEEPVFALELGGTPIDEFEFPEKGTVIIGSEELGVSPEALKLADNSLGRVTIPLHGTKSSLNVANATSILLHRWYESLKS